MGCAFWYTGSMQSPFHAALENREAPSAWQWPRFPIVLSDGALEGLKWVALCAMLFDHVERLVLSGPSFGDATIFGRLAFPLFAFILGYNLARPGADANVYRRVLMRLFVFGLLSIPATFSLFGSARLNILFTLATAVGILWLWRFRHRNRWLVFSLSLWLLLGSVLEYAWFGVGLVLAHYAWVRTRGSLLGITALILGYSGLAVSNGNHWGTAALILILLATGLSVKIPRLKWFFYAFYPLHLTIIALWRAWQGW